MSHENWVNTHLLPSTGSGYCYEYRELPLEVSLKQAQGFCGSARRLFNPIAKVFTSQENVVWKLRLYLAIKLIQSGALLLGSARHAMAQNLRLAVPYFNYYGVLCAARALVMTSPRVPWDGRNTLRLRHSKILTLASEELRALDSKRRDTWHAQLEALQHYRELYSYHFPLSGPNIAGQAGYETETAIAFARLLAELACLNSECLDGCLTKHAPDIGKEVDSFEHELVGLYDVAGDLKVDYDDLSRVGKLIYRWGVVSPLWLMMSDGMMDDLFGSWAAEEDLDGAFVPDDYATLLIWT